MMPGRATVIIGPMNNNHALKTRFDAIVRKHGSARRQDRRLMVAKTDTRESTAPQANRLKTSLTFHGEHQAYCWTTDRGRSRMIKH